MENFSDFDPKIKHHIIPFRERKLGRIESFDLVMYKYIPLKYVLNMLETHKMRFDNIKRWEDVYENFVDKEDIHLLNSKRTEMYGRTCYGQSWTEQEESDAMWRIYSPSKDAVRVKTVFPLISSMCGGWSINHKDNPILFTIDRVFYADEEEIHKWILSNTPMNHWAFIELQNESLFIKRREFEHEMEVRVIFANYRQEEEKDYIEVGFDPNKVFSEIVIDPRVNEEEFLRQRDSLVARGYDESKIRKSTLYDFQRVRIEVDMIEPCDFSITVYDKDRAHHDEPVFMKGPEA